MTVQRAEIRGGLVERLLRTGRVELRRLRVDPTSWADLDQPRRAQALWALQYDRRPADLPLLRFLLERESAVCRSDSRRGLSEEAALAAFLVCEYRRPEDVWRLWELKQANFDTACGLDVEHLVTGGVRATVELVRSGDRADVAGPLALLTDDAGGPVVTDAEVESWREFKRELFPADPRMESAGTWIDRALLVGERGLARELLEQWTAADPELLSTRKWYLETVFGEFAEAAAIHRQLSAGRGDPWDRASAQVAQARLERQAGRPLAAWEGLRHGGPLPKALRRWRRVNLARFYVEELFLLVPLMPRGNRAHQVFQLADRCAGIVVGLAPAALTAAVAAAEHVGDDRRRHRYQRRLNRA